MDSQTNQRHDFDYHCTECGWRGLTDDLFYPSWLLDDDYADYEGDCPKCKDTGTLVDYDFIEWGEINMEIAAMRSNRLLGNEREYVPSMREQFAAMDRNTVLDAAFGVSCILIILGVAYAIGLEVTR